jgi:hypothetical protein
VLRRIGVLGVLGCVLLMGWGAAGAATAQRAAFTVTLKGTLTKDWTLTRTVAEGECDKVTTSKGHWQLGLATRKSSRVVLLGPSGPGRPLRITSGVVRSIAGTASQTGSSRLVTRGPRCVSSTQTRNCGSQRRSFRNGTVRLTSPARSVGRFTRLQGAAAARSFPATCPEEPAEIRSIRTELTLADAPLDAADAFNRTVPRFFISGDTTQETTLEGEYNGTVTERVRWTLTFTRLKPS